MWVKKDVLVMSIVEVIFFLWKGNKNNEFQVNIFIYLCCFVFVNQFQCKPYCCHYIIQFRNTLSWNIKEEKLNKNQINQPFHQGQIWWGRHWQHWQDIPGVSASHLSWHYRGEGDYRPQPVGLHTEHGHYCEYCHLIIPLVIVLFLWLFKD